MNVLLGMLISGAWHGASWTFVVWGLLHGLGVVAVNLYTQARGPALPAWLAHGLTLLFVTGAWVFFRADSLAGALSMLQGVWTRPLGWDSVPTGPLSALVALACAFGFLSRHAQALQTQVVSWVQAAPVWAVGGVLSVCVCALIALGPSGVPGFIYYRF
jgi:hypothetical protein